jgi:ribonuclease inhibitor
MKIFIDGRDLDSKESLHGEFIEKLELPLYYGRNLDALHDCLTELSEPKEIYFYNFSAAEEKLGVYALSLKKVLEESAAENPKLKVSFFNEDLILE